MSKGISLLVTAMLTLSAFGMIVTYGSVTMNARAANHIVEPGGSIQDAIDSAAPGDTIYVWAGVYYENIVVNKTLTIIGNSSSDTTINGGGSGSVVTLEANGVNITGFEITGSGGSANDAGINLVSTWYCRVRDNIITGNRHGIQLGLSRHNTIENNNVTSNTGTGIRLRWISGLSSSTQNTIANNTISDNAAGFYFASYNDNNEIINNTVKDNNGHGISIYRSNSNQVINNTVTNNSNNGISLDMVETTVVEANHVNHNNNGIWVASWTDSIYSKSNIIRYNTMSNNTRYGLQMGPRSEYNYASHNIISNSSQYGIYLASDSLGRSFRDTMEHNTITDSGLHSMYMENTWLATLRNNTMTGPGIYIDGTNANFWDTHTIDENNTLGGRPVYYLKGETGGTVPEDAGQVILASCDDVTIENQNIIDATVLIGFSSSIRIDNISVSGPSREGIYMYRSPDCNISNGNILKSEGTGIHVGLSDNINIMNMTVNDSGGSGIHLLSSHRGVVEDTRIFFSPELAGTGDGLEVENSNNVVISDNTIFSNNRGIYIHTGSANYGIYSNHLFDNNDGLHLNGAGAGQLIYGNNVSDNNRHGIYISSSGENLMENNTVTSNNNDGIHVRTSVSSIVNNTLSYNGNDGVYVERTANGHFINNTIIDSGRWGMYTRGATGWQIKGNYIWGYNHNFAIYKTFIGSPIVRTGGHFISNNTVTGGGIVLLYPSQPSTIDGNFITDYSERGIRLDQFSASGYSSTGNIVSNNSLVAHPDSTDARGIFVCPECHGTVIENNTIENGMNGIFMGSVDNLVQRNKVSNLTQFGLVTGTSSQNNRIEDNTVLNSHYSIYLRGSEHSLFGNTIINSSLHGIYAYDVHNTVMENNTINGTQDNGIEIDGSSNVELYNNTILDASPHAIHLSSPTSCTLKGNVMHGTGIMMTGWSLSHWNSHIIDENNSVNSLPVIYRAGLTGGNVSGNPGQVIIADCTGMTLSDLTIEYGGVAVLLGFSDNNFIVNSTFVNNSYGIYLFSSEGNMIYHNNFINNSIQAHDGSSNHWDNGYPSGGNHWSDWTGPDEYGGIGQDEPGRDGIVDEPRNIPGGTGRDNYPWTTPGGWDILSPGVVLTSPVGGDVWTGGSDRNITWITTPGNGTIVGVDIEYSLDDGDTWTVIEEGLDDIGSYTWTVPDENSNQVRVRIFVHDDNNRTAYAMSGPFSIASAPSAPRNPQATPGNEQVILQWDAPLDDGGSTITNYTVYRGTESGNRTHLITLGNVLTYTDHDVINGVTYFYAISAVSGIGEGNLSEEVSATPATTPSAPQNVSAIPGDRLVRLEWDEPVQDGGSTITNYTIYRGIMPGVLFPLTTVGDVLNYTDNDVINGNTYYYSVSAVNSAGEGDMSEEVSATPATTPSAPRDLQAIPGDEMVLLEWDAPVSNGGAEITNYRIYRGTTPGDLSLLTTIGNLLTYTDESVDNGVTYYYQVSAVNWAGEGELSDEVSAKPATTPSAPRDLQATPGDEMVLLEWDAPVNDGGAEITNYRIYRGTTPGDLSLLTTIGNLLSYTDDSVDNGVTYYYQVSAVNWAGEGELSDEVSAKPATTPSAPRDLQATPGDEMVLLEWDAPLNNGGAEITNYNIYRGTEAGNLTLLVTIGDMLTYTDESVDNGVTYYYQISAVNSVGEGEFSEEVSATPSADITVPGTPRDLEAIPGNQQVILSWDAPLHDGGAEIINYRIYRGTTSGDLILLTTIGNVLSYTDENVDNGITYYYQVSAVNSEGEGGLSEEVSATPSADITVPGTPRDLEAIPGNQQVILSWDAPLHDGGAEITEYRIYRGTTSGALSYIHSVGGTTTAYTDTGVTNGVTYFYQVSAVNSAGEGERTAEMSATPIDGDFIPSDIVLTVVPLTGTAPLEVTITVSAENTGDLYGELDLQVDGTVIYTLQLPPGSIEEHTLTHTFHEHGTYLIEFGGEEETVMVSQAPYVHTVEISPSENQTMVAGGEITFTVAAYDQYGDLITEDPADFQWEGTDDDGLFTRQITGHYNVTVSYGGVTSVVVVVTVIPGGVHRVTLNPQEPLQVKAGDDITFTARAYDIYDNLITEVPGDFSWLNATGGIFYRETVGMYNVSAVYDGLSTSITPINVIPGDVHSVQISPDEHRFVRIGESYVFSAAAYDEFGNLITDEVTEFQWQGADENGLFMQDTADEYGVIASYGNVSSTFVTITVVEEEEDQGFLSQYWWVILAVLILMALVLILLLMKKKKKDEESPFDHSMEDDGFDPEDIDEDEIDAFLDVQVDTELHSELTER